MHEEKQNTWSEAFANPLNLILFLYFPRNVSTGTSFTGKNEDMLIL